MKKMTLLFTILCAAQLYGMAKEEAVGIYTSALPEIKQQIISAALASSKNVDEAIGAIKKFSILHRVQSDKLFNNFQDFIKVVNLLSENFPELTKSEIAEKVNPAFAKEYDDLNEQLCMDIRYAGPIEDIIRQLNEGADVNFYLDLPALYIGDTPLTLAVKRARVDVVELLLNSGANPFFKQPYNELTALDIVQNFLAQANNDEALVGKIQAIKALLENAMKK